MSSLALFKCNLKSSQDTEILIFSASNIYSGLWKRSSISVVWYLVPDGDWYVPPSNPLTKISPLEVPLPWKWVLIGVSFPLLISRVRSTLWRIYLFSSSLVFFLIIPPNSETSMSVTTRARVMLLRYSILLHTPLIWGFVYHYLDGSGFFHFPLIPFILYLLWEKGLSLLCCTRFSL